MTDTEPRATGATVEAGTEAGTTAPEHRSRAGASAGRRGRAQGAGAQGAGGEVRVIIADYHCVIFIVC